MLAALQSLQTHGTPIRVGLCGAGAMGRGIAAAVRRTPGMNLAWVSDLVEARAADAAALGGALRHSTNTQALLVDHPVNVFVEASTAVLAAAKSAMIAVENGAHIVWMNAEADLAFGPQVDAAAQRHGKIATSDAGDQHGVLARLLDEIELWGWKVVQAGNIKGFLDEEATPDSLRHEAAKRQLDPRACCAYTDGTKLAIEMAIIANARGFLVPEYGMRGPRVKHVSEALQHFDLAAALACPEVDYILGAEPGGGVYAIGYMDDPDERFLLDYYKLGAGPFYLHYRPCHLCHVETPLAIATAALENRALLAPGPRANDVFAVAKCDLPAGTPLTHAIGSPLIRGILRRCEKQDQRVPIWMIHDTQNCFLRKPLKKGETLTFQSTAIGELPVWP
ncbi:MAG: homoserine dehydrogenase [Verrucomicrobia bacterium]|nr:MAG: homoserine dehydrogenase [Verrucomicrobiota bacterium]